jgi:hypothetical protein
MSLGTHRMEHGTGADLWRRADLARSEEHHMVDGRRRGSVRWWSRDDQTLWSEEHYAQGEAHGIFRQWNSRGRLRRGFPCYFFRDVQVSKRTYLRRAALDPSLPAYRVDENSPERPLPPEYGEVAQKRW